MSNPIATIGFFDSGVGGLTILKAVEAKLRGCRFFYCADTKNFPYGPLTAEQVTAAVEAAILQIQNEARLDAIVIACNTASTVVLPHVRRNTPVPVVGVVPAIKPAFSRSRTKTIGLLATSGTVQGQYTEQLIRDFAADGTVVRVGAQNLARLAEEKLRGRAIPHGDVVPEIQAFIDNPDVDTVVLGCTHFPLLLPELQAALGREALWIDLAAAVADRVATVCGVPSTPFATSEVYYRQTAGELAEELRDGMQRYLGLRFT